MNLDGDHWVGCMGGGGGRLLLTGREDNIVISDPPPRILMVTAELGRAVEGRRGGLLLTGREDNIVIFGSSSLNVDGDWLGGGTRRRKILIDWEGG